VRDGACLRWAVGCSTQHLPPPPRHSSPVQAQKFDLVRLSFLCQRELERYIGDDTVCDMLRHADLLNAMALRLACLK